MEPTSALPALPALTVAPAPTTTPASAATASAGASPDREFAKALQRAREPADDTPASEADAPAKPRTAARHGLRRDAPEVERDRRAPPGPDSAAKSAGVPDALPEPATPEAEHTDDPAGLDLPPAWPLPWHAAPRSSAEPATTPRAVASSLGDQTLAPEAPTGARAGPADRANAARAHPDPVTLVTNAAAPTIESAGLTSPAAPAADALAVPVAAAAADRSAPPEPTLPWLAAPTSAAPRADAATPAPQAPATRTVAPPIDGPQFAPALGQQVSLLVREGVQEATLQLNPADMGPVRVQIALDGVAARVDFHADLAATRQAIESSLPALAGALHESGLTLAGGGVFQGQGGARDGARPQPMPQARSGGAVEGDDDTGSPRIAAAPARPRRGLVDLVA